MYRLRSDGARPERPAQAGVGRSAAAASRTGPAGPPGPQAEAGPTPPYPEEATGPDDQGEGGLHLQAPLPDHPAAGPAEQVGSDRPGYDAGLPPRVEDLADLRGSVAGPLCRGPERAPGLEAAPCFGDDPRFSGGARAGGSDRDAGGGVIRQDGRLPEKPGVPTGADEQPRGADQPEAASSGEGPIQVAESAHAGAVHGLVVGSVLDPGASDSQPKPG